MEATIDDTGTMLPTSQLAPEYSHMEEIGIQLINVESMSQTIRKQLRILEDNGNEDMTVLELKSLLPKLAGLQGSLRKFFDAYSRPLIRKLHIFNLPEELLMKIFQDVRGDFSATIDDFSATIDNFPRTGIKDIKSLRLTCKRFSDSSSHLLIHHLDVSLTNWSLERLDKVSRHPTISKGIRSLRICAALFKPLPVTGLEEFIRQAVGVLQQDYASEIESMREFFDGTDRLYGTLGSFILDPEDHVRFLGLVEDLRNRNNTMLYCTRYLRGEITPQEENRNLATLSRVYAEYSQLWNGQNMLLQDGTFARVVAQAVARLSPGASMTITDRTGSDFRTLSNEILNKVYANVRKRLLEPRCWFPKTTSPLTERPINLLYELPIAVAKAGNPLTELRIRLDMGMKHVLLLVEEEAEDLISAAEHLKVLEIGFQVKSQTTEEQIDLYKLVSLLCKGTNLRSVTLKLEYYFNRGTSNAGPLLALLPGAKLREIRLKDISAHCEELSELLKKLAPGTYISLDGLCLLSGLWADLLDVLRTKASCDSEVKSPMIKSRISWHGEENVRLPTPSSATAYIRGELLENPLRSHPAQDNADQDDMDQDDVD